MFDIEQNCFVPNTGPRRNFNGEVRARDWSRMGEDCQKKHPLGRAARQELRDISYRSDRYSAVADYAGTATYRYWAVIGKRTVNSLPSRRPALIAVTQPPWLSTRLRTNASPVPSPASARRREDSACTNRSNTVGNISGAMPIPVSRMRTTAAPALPSTVRPTSPPTSAHLAAP